MKSPNEPWFYPAELLPENKELTLVAYYDEPFGNIKIDKAIYDPTYSEWWIDVHDIVYLTKPVNGIVAWMYVPEVPGSRWVEEDNETYFVREGEEIG